MSGGVFFFLSLSLPLIFPLGDIYNPTLIAWLRSINTIRTNLGEGATVGAGVSELLITARSIGPATGTTR